MSRRLIRATDLAGFRRAVARLALEGTLADIRSRVVIVPSRAAAELLRQTLEGPLTGESDCARVLPDLLTRDEWHTRWVAALPDSPRLLSRVEREVMLAAAARATAGRRRMGGAPFQLRPGLVAAMLEFYDELRRRLGTVGRLRREVIAELKGVHGFDRGSDSLIHQTAFLTLTFLKYERARDASSACDEHVGRARLLQEATAVPHAHVVVAVADHPSDPRGLWPADFDLIGRRRDLRVDVVMTDELHDAGFRERLERELPGVEEVRESGQPWRPVVRRPESGWCWISRDREEEVRDVARQIRGRLAHAGPMATTALVVQRPLPYLYLVRQVFQDARLPWQALEALPLATEPWAAVLDLVLVVARTGGTRESIVALLRSPWITFSDDGRPLALRDVAALDGVLTARRTTAPAVEYPEDVRAFFDGADRRDGFEALRALRAARVAARVGEALSAAREAGTAAEQLRGLLAFLRAHERAGAAPEDRRDESLRARGAVLGALHALADAFDRHDPGAREAGDLVAWVRHRLEGQTFAVARGRAGILLVDAVTARFGEFAHVHLLGLVDSEWPERQRRNIFYTSGLLRALGWPQDRDHATAQLAAFRDLTGLPSESLSLHGFELDADAVVGPSPMVDLVRGLPDHVASPPPAVAIFTEDVLRASEPDVQALDPALREWVGARAARPALTVPPYRGQIGAQSPPAHGYRISRVDTYVTCPFKYYAQSILRLPEERDDSAGLTPLERGTLLHDLFERFYREWQADGRGPITLADLPDAVARFTALAQARLSTLPEADRVLEQTRLLGSLVARGVAERVFELEAESDLVVDYRLLEQPLQGAFTFPALGGLQRVSIAINGKADRIDVLTDGRIRVIDYKLGRMPDLSSSIQIATYAHAAQQQLEADDHEAHPVAAASYLAFGDEYKLEGAIGGKAEAAAAVEARAQVFAEVVGRIEAGQFPARPRQTVECEWCPYSGVCRKEYALEGGEDAAESV